MRSLLTLRAGSDHLRGKTNVLCDNVFQIKLILSALYTFANVYFSLLENLLKSALKVSAAVLFLLKVFLRKY